MPDRTLEELWETAARATERFDPARIAGLPEGARRYLSYAIAPGALLPSAARLEMHGTIRLKDDWDAFEAVQVIRWDRGFVWRARVKVKGLRVSGFDRLVDGEGKMRWKLFGLIPFLTAEGAEISMARRPTSTSSSTVAARSWPAAFHAGATPAPESSTTSASAAGWKNAAASPA